VATDHNRDLGSGFKKSRLTWNDDLGDKISLQIIFFPEDMGVSRECGKLQIPDVGSGSPPLGICKEKAQK